MIKSKTINQFYLFKKCLIAKGTYPSIAQLAERETVEAKQLSLGHWFESGWTETFFNFYGFQLVFPSSVHVISQTIL